MEHKLGYFNSAIQSHQRALLLAIRIKLSGEEHESTADSYYSLGITQLKKDDLKPALKSLQSALTIRVKLFGEKHKATAESYYSIGLTQQKMGSLRPALQSFRRVLAINIKLFGEEQESVRTADIYVHLWTIQHELGYFKSALHSKKRALAIRISLCGEKHKITAYCYHLLGMPWPSALNCLEENTKVLLKVTAL